MSTVKRRIRLDELLCDQHVPVVAGERYEVDGAITGIDDNENRPDGNRETDVPTIAIAVTDPDGSIHTTYLTWQQARDFASGINLIVDIAEFG